MVFDYKGGRYMLAELKEPNKIETYDIIAIFKVGCNNYDKNNHEFVNYFYGTDASDNELIEFAKKYINAYIENKKENKKI